MKRSLAVGALLFAAACREDVPLPSVGGGAGEGGQGGAADGGAPAGGATAGALIMSWNLETFPKSGDTVEKASAAIKQLKPALLAVVEVDDTGTFSSMVGDLPGYAHVLNDDPGAFTHVGLVFDESRVTIGEVDTLFQGDSYAFPRPPLRATVHLTLDDGSLFDFVAIVLHLKAMVDDDSEARRRDAVEKLDVYLRMQLENGEQDDFMLLGDLNDKIDDPPQWNVFGPFLDAPDTYSFLTKGEAESGDYSYIPFTSLIDHIMVTNGALAELGSDSAQIFHLEDEIGAYESTVSDHLPVGIYATGTAAR